MEKTPKQNKTKGKPVDSVLQLKLLAQFTMLLTDRVLHRGGSAQL